MSHPVRRPPSRLLPRFYGVRLGVLAMSAYCIGMAAYTIHCALNGPPYNDAYGVMVRAAFKHFVGY